MSQPSLEEFFQPVSPLSKEQPLLETQQSSQLEGSAQMINGDPCELSTKLKEYSQLTAQTVSSIFSQISHILSLLKEQHQMISKLSNFFVKKFSQSALEMRHSTLASTSHSKFVSAT